MTDQTRECKNTDRELWREADDYYANSIRVTERGGIGINVGGTVIVKPLAEWHRLASTPSPEPLREAERRIRETVADAEAMDLLDEPFGWDGEEPPNLTPRDLLAALAASPLSVEITEEMVRRVARAIFDNGATTEWTPEIGERLGKQARAAILAMQSVAALRSSGIDGEPLADRAAGV